MRGPIGGARLARRIWRHQCTRFDIIKLRAQKLLLHRLGRTQEDVLPDLRLAAVMPTTQAGHETESIGGLPVQSDTASEARTGGVLGTGCAVRVDLVGRRIVK